MLAKERSVICFFRDVEKAIGSGPCSRRGSDCLYIWLFMDKGNTFLESCFFGFHIQGLIRHNGTISLGPGVIQGLLVFSFRMSQPCRLCI
jgi:hypothetical protein